MGTCRICGRANSEDAVLCSGPRCGASLEWQRDSADGPDSIRRVDHAVQTWCEPDTAEVPLEGGAVTFTVTARNAGLADDTFRLEPPIGYDGRVSIEETDVDAPTGPREVRTWHVTWTLLAASSADDHLLGVGGLFGDTEPGPAPHPGPKRLTLRVVSAAEPRAYAATVFTARFAAATPLPAPPPPVFPPSDAPTETFAAPAVAPWIPARLAPVASRFPWLSRSRRNARVGAVAVTVATLGVLALLVGMAAASSIGGSGHGKHPLAHASSSKAGADGSDGSADPGDPGASSSTNLMTVPNVVGLPQAQGVAELRGAGFAPTVASMPPSGHGRPGVARIISQMPPGGSKAAPGASVNLTVSTSASASPSATSSTSTTAAPAPGDSPSVPDPASSTGAPPPGTQVAVPNLVGTTAAQAQQLLAAAHLTGSEVRTSGGGIPGTVVSSDPAAGTMVPAGSTVQFTVVAIGVPDVVGKSDAAARQELRAAHLNMAVGAVTGLGKTCTVQAQSPRPGALLVAGDTVTVTEDCANTVPPALPASSA